MKDIAERVKELRTALGLTQEGLGRLAGVTKSAVSQWERGVTQPQRDALMALQSKKRINPDWVIHGKGEKILEVIDGKVQGYLYPPSTPLTPHAVMEVDTRVLPEEIRPHVDALIRLCIAGKLTERRMRLLVELASPEEDEGLA